VASPIFEIISVCYFIRTFHCVVKHGHHTAGNKTRKKYFVFYPIEFFLLNKTIKKENSLKCVYFYGRLTKNDTMLMQ
jgi:hypothetical protein